MAVDWSQLPPDMIVMMSRKLTVYIDYLRFRAVCVNWRSAVSKRPDHLPCQLPWLMLPNTRNNDTCRGFFSLSDDKIHWLELPEASRRRRCCGSSQGWLVVVEESPVIRLLNPLTRAQIQLPPLTTFPNVLGFDVYRIGKEYTLQTSSGDCYSRNLKEMRDSFLKKVILSSSPASSSEYVALAILNETGELAFCRHGDEGWTFIEDAQPCYEDVICYKGLFYAVDRRGKVVICDVSGVSPVVTVINTLWLFGGDILYLVEQSGELLLVTRHLELGLVEPDMAYKTIRFEVAKLDSSSQNWVKLKGIGDHVLFLGKNSSLSLSASDYPECRRNCIYFTDDYSEVNFEGVRGDYDVGVFNLEDDSIEPLLCYSQSSLLIWPPPLWITPNPF
ncbi:PREDICTED: F-box protein SKIP23-like [Nelumbo nucifera]|uniref:F-box protein SKIP23-like n=2 Tax=Nelumbo nucifera TaxID=4432 RepID=A0A1U8AVH9_NELNU|nr:PREDICTED: F-box protein SKIP23-like [Nelumbo nucifera]DAD46658.1 TPA_asm: hypothetical protein HUJ06_016595 [Nelumbo nucifera]